MTRVSRGLTTAALAASSDDGHRHGGPRPTNSRVSALNVGDMQPVGTFNGVAYAASDGHR